MEEAVAEMNEEKEKEEMEPTGRLTIEKMRELVDPRHNDPLVVALLLRSLIEWVAEIDERLGGV